MTTELLPCPFCGGPAARVDNWPAEDGDEGAHDGGSFIRCERCDASTTIHYDRKENLVASWNERHGMEVLASDINDLDELVHLLAIEDDCMTPVEAVQAIIDELKDLREQVANARRALGCCQFIESFAPAS